jgi:hypothetical protein
VSVAAKNQDGMGRARVGEVIDWGKAGPKWLWPGAMINRAQDAGGATDKSKDERELEEM